MQAYTLLSCLPTWLFLLYFRNQVVTGLGHGSSPVWEALLEHSKLPGHVEDTVDIMYPECCTDLFFPLINPGHLYSYTGQTLCEMWYILVNKENIIINFYCVRGNEQQCSSILNLPHIFPACMLPLEVTTAQKSHLGTRLSVWYAKDPTSSRCGIYSTYH